MRSTASPTDCNANANPWKSKKGGVLWNSAVKGGIFARIGHVEISHDELLDMTEREHSLQKRRT